MWYVCECVSKNKIWNASSKHRPRFIRGVSKPESPCEVRDYGRYQKSKDMLVKSTSFSKSRYDGHSRPSILPEIEISSQWKNNMPLKHQTPCMHKRLFLPSFRPCISGIGEGEWVIRIRLRSRRQEHVGEPKIVSPRCPLPESPSFGNYVL
jgi:hypothetical protein